MNHAVDAGFRWRRYLRALSATNAQTGFVVAGFLVVLAYTGHSVLTAVSSILTSRANVQANGLLRSGDTFPPIEGIDFNASGPAVVAVLRRNCVYCTRSFDFYRRLIPTAQKTGISFVALCTDSRSVCERYVSEGGVTADRVVSSAAVTGELKIAGTPTLLLVDRQGTIRQIWTGWQDESHEHEVLRALAALAAERAPFHERKSS